MPRKFRFRNSPSPPSPKANCASEPRVSLQATRLHSLIEDFFLRVAILPWDSEAAQHYGHLRASLERDGRPMGNLDTMIAAHAIALGATLVTNDRAFARIKKLKVEDWTKRPHQ